MKKNFETLVDTARKVVERCPWTEQKTAEEYAEELRKETDEVMEAIAAQNTENLKEELGDLLWDTVMVALLAERQGHFKAEEIVDGVVEKIRHRKPYIFEGRKVTIEEAERIWAEAKAAEKALLK